LVNLILGNYEEQPKGLLKKKLVPRLLANVVQESLDNGEFASYAGKQYLESLIAAAPGFVGSRICETSGPPRDTWTVYWANDAAVSTRHVEKQLTADIEVLRKATKKIDEQVNDRGS
jgi:hypothetical protein